MARSVSRAALVLVVLVSALGCSGPPPSAGAPEPSTAADAGPGTWCCYEDDAHAVVTCGLTGGRALPAFCWDDAIPSHPGDS